MKVDYPQRQNRSVFAPDDQRSRYPSVITDGNRSEEGLSLRPKYMPLWAI